MASSNIEWTDETWNPVVGCTPVSPGCLNCYAATMAGTRLANRPEYVGLTVKRESRSHGVTESRSVFNGTVRMLPDRLTEPCGWKKPRLVFVNSMSDLFHEDVPFEFIDHCFAVMWHCARHTFQVLTKRPGRMAEYFAGKPWERWYTIIQQWLDLGCPEYAEKPELCIFRTEKEWEEARAWAEDLRFDEFEMPDNVWLGTSVEDQARADERIALLLKCPVASGGVRFLSCEPLIGAVDLSAFMGGQYVGLPGDVVHPNYNFGIGWVIVGGESGTRARPCNVAWIESIVTQCKGAGVPVFVKQLGARPYCGCGCGVGPNRDGSGQHAACGKSELEVPLVSRKGNEVAEWPERLRVREWPAGYASSSS